MNNDLRLRAAITLLVPLTGCDFAQPPQTQEQIQAEIAKLPRDRPGLWSVHEDIATFSAGGAPAAVAASMQKEMETQGRLGWARCITPQMAATSRYKALRSIGDESSSCTITAFHSDGQIFDAAQQCSYPNGLSGTVEFEGSAVGKVQQMKYNVAMASPEGEGPSLSYSGIRTIERTGDCTGP